MFVDYGKATIALDLNGEYNIFTESASFATNDTTDFMIDHRGHLMVYIKAHERLVRQQISALHDEVWTHYTIMNDNLVALTKLEIELAELLRGING